MPASIAGNWVDLSLLHCQSGMFMVKYERPNCQRQPRCGAQWSNVGCNRLFGGTPTPIKPTVKRLHPRFCELGVVVFINQF